MVLSSSSDGAVAAACERARSLDIPSECLPPFGRVVITPAHHVSCNRILVNFYVGNPTTVKASAGRTPRMYIRLYDTVFWMNGGESEAVKVHARGDGSSSSLRLRR
ncbi:unnamed protein product, partial [Iphiclides podalirius]